MHHSGHHSRVWTATTIGGAGDVDRRGHGRVQLARLQGTVADGVEDAAEAIGAEQVAQAGGVLGVERDDAGAGEPPGRRGPRADDLAGIALLEVVQGVVAGNAGDAGDEQRQAGGEAIPEATSGMITMIATADRPGDHEEETMMEQQQTLARQVSEALERNRGTMTLQLAHDLGVPEAEVVRALPDGRAVELDAGRWEEIIRSFEGLGKVHVIVSNGGDDAGGGGPVRRLQHLGRFLQRADQIAGHAHPLAGAGAVFAVEKPSHMNDEVTTLSVQFFDRGGTLGV